MRKLAMTWSGAAALTLLLGVSGCDRAVKLLAERVQPPSASAASSQAVSPLSLQEEHADQHKEEVGKTFGFSSVLTDMKDSLKAAKELQRRKRDNKDFAKERPPGGLLRLVEGHPAQLIEKYNELIASSNNFRM